MATVALPGISVRHSISRKARAVNRIADVLDRNDFLAVEKKVFLGRNRSKIYTNIYVVLGHISITLNQI